MSGAPASIDARPHLVLVHGLNNTPSVWDGVVAGIGARAHCHVPFLPALDSVDAIADGLLPTLPARFHLCGFSFGGFVALAMLARAPERVAGFALLNSTVLADDPGLAGQRRRAIEIAAGGGHRAMMDKQFPNSVETAHVADAALQQRFGRMVDEYGAERFMAHMRAVLERPDRRALVAAAGCPLLAITSGEDRVVPPAMQRALVQAAPRADSVEIDGAAHLLPLERPGVVAAALCGWLDRSMTCEGRTENS